MVAALTVATISKADFGSFRLSSVQQNKFVSPQPIVGGMSPCWYIKKARLAYGLPWEKFACPQKRFAGTTFPRQSQGFVFTRYWKMLVLLFFNSFF